MRRARRCRRRRRAAAASRTAARSSRGPWRAAKIVTVCTNALLLDKKIDQYKPHRDFNWSIHLDGDEEMHDQSVCQAASTIARWRRIRLAKAAGFRVNVNCTLFDGADPARVADFLDETNRLGVEGVTISPGYAYERAPDQQHFLNRDTTQQLFRDIFARGTGGKAWPFYQSSLFLDFLAGNQSYRCTPWGNPTRTVFGWQRPCYLLGEGYATTFRELMEDTDWDGYGVGNYEKCADCMVHSGFEATAVIDSANRPLTALKVMARGVRTGGPMAPDIPLDKARPAKFVFSTHVERRLAEIRAGKTSSEQVEAAE